MSLVCRNVTAEKGAEVDAGLDLLDHSVIPRPLKVRSEADLGSHTPRAHIRRLGGSQAYIPAVQLGGEGKETYPGLEDLTSAFEGVYENT